MSEEVLSDFCEDEDTQKNKYMTFRTGNEYYGIELKYINEIIGIQPITKIPEVEDYIKGLINLRGRIIPVIDVRVRFRQEELPYNDRTCIIIINVRTTVVGLIVEKIAGVIRINDENIETPPNLSAWGTKNHYVYGLGKTGDSVKLLLDVDKLIQDDEELFDEIAVLEEVEAE